jgi:hypothetical protein
MHMTKQVLIVIFYSSLALPDEETWLVAWCILSGGASSVLLLPICEAKQSQRTYQPHLSCP